MIEKFEINEFNKALFDKNYVKSSNDNSNISCSRDGSWEVAKPLNDDPDVQYYGGITDVLKHGYLNKDYKIGIKSDISFKCKVTEEPYKLYDVILLLNEWEEAVLFAVFMGVKDNEVIYKYLGNDEIRTFIHKIPARQQYDENAVMLKYKKF